MMQQVLSLGNEVGIKAACDALSVPRSTFYRHSSPDTTDAEKVSKRPTPPLALNESERQAVLDLLHSKRFCDMAPHQVYADLLDEGRYICSVRTMYRLPEAEHGEVRERRRQVQRSAYKKPELLATQPNQVWSWDITKLKGPAKWNYFHLYVIIDIFSRYVVGWMVAPREQDALAKKLIEQTCQKQHILTDQLTIHADRGSSMKSKVVAHLLADMGITKTHSRPQVSNDNPYSEAQFRTLRYCPQFPERFGCIEDARAFCRLFFQWYNKEHHHSGIALMTPEQVHYHMDEHIFENRSRVLADAFKNNPKRFKGKMPVPESLPEAVWINKPESE